MYPSLDACILDWVPGVKSIVGMAGLAAYYDTLTPGSLSVNGSNQAQLWGDLSGNSGVNGLALDGVAGNYASTPNQTLTSSDVDVIVRINLAVIADAALLAQDNGTGRNWVFSVGAAGMGFSWWDSGNAYHAVTSSVTPGMVAGISYWVRVTFRANNGLGDHECKFYVNADSPQIPAVWTQLGTTRHEGLFNTSIRGTPSPIWIGANFNTSTSLITGIVYYVQFANTINGAAILKFDPSNVSKLVGSFVSGTGETWTINSSGDTGARISGARDMYQGTAANRPIYTPQVGSVLPYLTFDGISRYLKTAPFLMVQPEWVVLVGIQLGWTSADVIFDGAASNSGALTQTTSTPQVNITAGSSVGANTGWTVGADGIAYAIFYGASSSLGINRLAATTGNAGSANMGGITLGANGGATAFGNVLVRGFAVLSIHPTQAQIDQVVKWASRRYSIAI